MPVNNVQTYHYLQSLLLQFCLIHHIGTNFILVVSTAVELTLTQGSMI